MEEAKGYKRANAKSNAKAVNGAQRHFEIAIGFLLEHFKADPSLSQWIDRNVSDSVEDATGFCGSAMPRCVKSRGDNTVGGGSAGIPKAKE